MAMRRIRDGRVCARLRTALVRRRDNVSRRDKKSRRDSKSRREFEGRRGDISLRDDRYSVVI